MKKIATLIIILACGFSGKAQGGFDFGLKAGLNTSKISTDLSDYTPQTVNNYLFGAFARINLGRIYLQPEAYFNSKGGEVISHVGIETINSFDLNTVDVPALLGFKIIDKKPFNLRIMAGPAFYFVTNKSVSEQLTKEKVTDNFFGWQYGAGVDFMFLTLDARMESYTKNLYDAPDFNSKNGNFVISLGVKLF
jgi:opacity protein-like surface antigen